MRRIAGLVVVGGVVAILACDATSPVNPSGNPAPSIAFESDRYGSPGVPVVFLANDDGTGVRVLVDGSVPAWSRDGTRIAYYNYDDSLGHPAGIYVIDPDGSHRRFVASALPGPPAWGPGDRDIAYQASGGIFVIAADGSTQPRKLIGDDLALPRPEGWADADHGPGVVGLPVWSPNGDRIAFQRADPLTSDSGVDLTWYVIAANGSNPRLLGGSCRMPTLQYQYGSRLPGWCPVTGLAWSPSGVSLAITSYALDAETGEREAVLGIMPASSDPDSAQLSNMDILYRGDVVSDPQWSPDGSAIIFDSNPDAAHFDASRILVVSLDSRLVRQLIPDAANALVTPYFDRHPAWRQSP